MILVIYSQICSSELLIGLWIGDNLFTISQSEMKSNRLSDLKLLDDIDLINYTHLIVQEETPNANQNAGGDNIGNNTVSNVTVVSRDGVEG